MLLEEGYLFMKCVHSSIRFSLINLYTGPVDGVTDGKLQMWSSIPGTERCLLFNHSVSVDIEYEV